MQGISTPELLQVIQILFIYRPKMAMVNITQTVPLPHEHRSPRRLLLSSESPACQYRTIVSSLEAHKAVCSMTLLNPSSLILPSRFDALVHTTQGSGRWLLWDGLALRLARNTPTKYTTLSNAAWRRGKTGVGRQTPGGSQAHEKEVGRRLGRVPETQGTRGV